MDQHTFLKRKALMSRHEQLYFACKVAPQFSYRYPSVNTGVYNMVVFHAPVFQCKRDSMGVEEEEENEAASLAAVHANAAAWRRALRLLMQRFSGRMLLRGRLLNPHELLVTRVRRTDALAQPLAGESAVRIPQDLALRVAVRCDDGAERVGRDTVALVVQCGAAGVSAALNDDDDAVANVLPETTSAELLRSAAWDDAQLLLERDSLFGFDVRALLQLSVSQLPDESANAVLTSAPTFHDLRCTQLLMRERCGAAWLQQHSTVQSFFLENAKRIRQPLVTAEAHPRSYVSLGQAQKRRWADERFDAGKELVAKGRLKDAVVEFTHCLKLDETHVAAQFARGEAHVALQQFADAVSDFESVQTLDSAFAGLDTALFRARGKQSHSRRVDLHTSALPGRPAPLLPPVVSASAVVRRSPSQQPADRAQSVGGIKQQPSSSYASSSSAAEQLKRLERDRLRRLLEAEVGGRREKHTRHRRREDAGKDSSDSDSESDSDAHRKRKAKKKHKKAKKKKLPKAKKHKRPRTGDDDSDNNDDDSDTKRSSSRKRNESKHRRRSRHQRHDSASSDSSVVSDRRSAGGESRSKSSSRNGRDQRRERDRHFRRSSDRSEQCSVSPAAAAREELHPILARQRHRIWN